jgi:ATP-dependent RNA helicase RhlE
MPDHQDFYSFGIAPDILSVLARLKFTIPTPIQSQSIPVALQGKDLVGIAQTGTGKTLAFGIPIVQAALKGNQGLVVLPTRELAAQVNDELRKIGLPMGLRTAVLIGGESIGRQIQTLRRSPQIVIGTPGRIVDHLTQKTLNLSHIGVLVLDEADRMLDMGFAPQLNRILTAIPKKRQTMLFSATMPEQIFAMARTHMQLPVRVEIAPQGTAAARVTQEAFFVPKQDKPRLLDKVLQEYRGTVLVFTRTKFGAKKVAATVRALGHTAAELHSNRSLNQRREALDGFKKGKYRVLVATDIAARGIDVQGIQLVLNYDLPDNSEDYVHRIGRTARAGGAGHALSFATPDQRGDIRAIERLIRTTLPFSKLPELPPASAHVVVTRDAPRPPFRPRSTSSSSTGSGNRSRSGGDKRRSFGGPRRSSGGFRSRSPRR